MESLAHHPFGVGTTQLHDGLVGGLSPRVHLLEIKRHDELVLAGFLADQPHRKDW